jgi:hypothetical protein
MMGNESYIAHQLNYFKHVNMQEAHRNDYYTNRTLSISRPLEVFTVIHDKMDYESMSKQPQGVLLIKSKPLKDFLSYMYQL